MYLRLRDLREDSEINQKILAKYLNVHQATYSDCEHGNINIPIPSFIKLADFYKTSIDYIVGRTDQKEIFYNKPSKKQNNNIGNFFIYKVVNIFIWVKFIVKKFIYPFWVLCAGILNGMLGAGGGMLVVPILKKYGIETRKTHATSICIILPMCILSSIIYMLKGKVTLSDALPYIPYGIVGAIVGSIILSKINQKLLSNVFALFMMWAAIQLLIR